jgi:hypothetical protein
MVQLMAAARTDPAARLELARRIFDDAFTDEIPQAGAVKNSRGMPISGYARRDTVPEMPPAPVVYPDDQAATDLSQSEHDNALIKRQSVIADNERKLRALLWAHKVFLEQDPDGDFVHTLESGIREWFLCSLPVLPTTTDAIEQCVKANAKASWATLKRVARERTVVAAE